LPTVVDARQAVEAAARESYGRLISYLSARCGDVALAEDALGDAFLTALRTWPERGVPERPEAWLLTAARNRLIDHTRRAQVRTEHAAALELAARDAEQAATFEDEFPDDRLKMLFLCADPAVDASVRTPLMLQTVLGLDAARIASAFLVSPAAMSQRLVRAKARIRDQHIPFEVPAPRELATRLDAVTQAIYAAYARGWEDQTGADAEASGLSDEAIWLARVLVRLIPSEPEARGLLALMLHCEARREARRSEDGRYVPITEQDVHQWNMSMVEEAERHLYAAAKQNKPGRFQLEAAIQSVHADRARTGRTEWGAIAQLYEGLVSLAPTAGALVGRAAAMSEVNGPAAGLALLEELQDEAVRIHQPFWAVRAHLLARLSRAEEARAAYDRAIGLAEDEAVRRFLISRQSAVVSSR
jgi:RNA polymerase sigma-70 factor (ECF subfamily)